MSKESKEIYISSTPHETRLAIVEKDELAEIYYERENEYTLAGSIYNGKVTRVLPGMQSAFVDVGLERDAFLYITDFMEEQGESADFEAEGSRSTGRGEGKRERGGGQERGEGRERGESRDRGEARDGGQARDGGPGRGESRRRAEQPRAQAAPAEEGDTVTIEGQAEGLDNGDESGEGSRRWRGRRGRRRGRTGGEPREGAQAESGAEGGEVEASQPRELERGAERGGDRSEPRAERGSSDRGDDRGGRAREDRGRGDRDRGRVDSVRERFAPRGHRRGSEECQLMSMHRVRVRRSRSFCPVNPCLSTAGARPRSRVEARGIRRQASRRGRGGAAFDGVRTEGGVGRRHDAAGRDAVAVSRRA